MPRVRSTRKVPKSKPLTDSQLKTLEKVTQYIMEQKLKKYRQFLQKRMEHVMQEGESGSMVKEGVVLDLVKIENDTMTMDELFEEDSDLSEWLMHHNLPCSIDKGNVDDEDDDCTIFQDGL